MAVTLNARIADALTRRHLQVSRVETRQRLDIWAALVVLEAEILAALKVADPAQFALLSRRRRAVELLMADSIVLLVTTRYARLADSITAFLLRLVLQEAVTVQQLTNAAADEELLEETPSEAALRRAVTQARIPTPARPTDLSATGEEWWQRQREGLIQRLRDQLLVSVSLEEPLTQAVARIKGTSDLGFQDGIMAKAKEDAARLLRIQVTNAVSEARVALADANPETGIVLEHHSTIDSRTSTICLVRQGLRYTLVDHEPIGHSLPFLSGCPYHVGCRSTHIPVLASGPHVGQEGLEAWLRRQGDAVQDAMLGPRRAQMFRAGKLTLKSLLDAATGRPLTLEELGVA